MSEPDPAGARAWKASARLAAVWAGFGLLLVASSATSSDGGSSFPIAAMAAMAWLFAGAVLFLLGLLVRRELLPLTAFVPVGGVGVLAAWGVVSLIASACGAGPRGEMDWVRRFESEREAFGRLAELVETHDVGWRVERDEPRSGADPADEAVALLRQLALRRAQREDRGVTLTARSRGLSIGGSEIGFVRCAERPGPLVESVDAWAAWNRGVDFHVYRPLGNGWYLYRWHW
ncbi:MAG: hypothetical protein ACF8XB_14210 [Planctomycetota bacterium JB042]